MCCDDNCRRLVTINSSVPQDRILNIKTLFFSFFKNISEVLSIAPHSTVSRPFYFLANIPFPHKHTHTHTITNNIL